MGSYMQYRVRVAGGTAWDVFSPDIASKIRLGSQVVTRSRPDDILLLPGFVKTWRPQVPQLRGAPFGC